uniref:Uncharacterized protein n=1 Tax=Hyaloperonospora arabidopsidis (strain Emoy2) TaxID=559515 RepID=M4C0P2_HYAAE
MTSELSTLFVLSLPVALSELWELTELSSFSELSSYSVSGRFRLRDQKWWAAVLSLSLLSGAMGSESLSRCRSSTHAGTWYLLIFASSSAKTTLCEPDEASLDATEFSKPPSAFTALPHVDRHTNAADTKIDRRIGQ